MSSRLDTWQSSRAILQFTRIGIDSLFKKIGCDRRQIDHLLQSNDGVTEDNMLRYLGIIEERTNELLTAQATITAKVKISFLSIELVQFSIRNKIFHYVNVLRI